MSDLTPEERAAIEARHRSDGEAWASCQQCEGDWPCDAARLLAALTAAEALVAGLPYHRPWDVDEPHREYNCPVCMSEIPQRIFGRLEAAEARALPSDEEASLALTALAESVRAAAIMRTERVTIQAPLARYLLALLAEPVDDGGQQP